MKNGLNLICLDYAKKIRATITTGYFSINKNKSRDDVPALIMALLKIYNTPKYNSKVFSILDEKILKGNKNTGRNGLNLWQIFVLAQFRLALNIDYDRLHCMVYLDFILR